MPDGSSQNTEVTEVNSQTRENSLKNDFLKQFGETRDFDRKKATEEINAKLEDQTLTPDQAKEKTWEEEKARKKEFDKGDFNRKDLSFEEKKEEFAKIGEKFEHLTPEQAKEKAIEEGKEQAKETQVEEAKVVATASDTNAVLTAATVAPVAETVVPPPAPAEIPKKEIKDEFEKLKVKQEQPGSQQANPDVVPEVYNATDGSQENPPPAQAPKQAFESTETLPISVPTSSIETVSESKKPDMATRLEEEKASRGRELTNEERYNIVRNFYLGELGYYLKANEVGGAKDHFVYDESGNKINGEDGNPVKFPFAWKRPKLSVEELTAEGKISSQSKEQSLLKFLEDEYSNKAPKPADPSLSEVDLFLNKARSFNTGERLTEGEKRIAEEKFYLKKLDGYNLKSENSRLGAFLRNTKEVSIIKRNGAKILGTDNKVQKFKINWTTGVPSQELLGVLKKEYENSAAAVGQTPKPAEAPTETLDSQVAAEEQKPAEEQEATVPTAGSKETITEQGKQAEEIVKKILNIYSGKKPISILELSEEAEKTAKEQLNILQEEVAGLPTEKVGGMDLKAGDIIINSDGKPEVVLSASPRVAVNGENVMDYGLLWSNGEQLWGVGTNAGKFSRVITKVTESPEEKPETPATKPLETAVPAALTQEAQDLLKKVAEGGIPLSVTNGFEKILKDNGISQEDIDKNTPQELIQMLKDKTQDATGVNSQAKVTAAGVQT